MILLTIRLILYVVLFVGIYFETGVFTTIFAGLVALQAEMLGYIVKPCHNC